MREDSNKFVAEGNESAGELLSFRKVHDNCDNIGRDQQFYSTGRGLLDAENNIKGVSEIQ